MIILLETWFETLFETVKMFKEVKKVLLLPVYAFSVSYTVFLIIDISKSFIACGYGFEFIGIWFR